MSEPLSDGHRFYIVQTSGYPGPGPYKYEHEYAVVDEATAQTVALFLASYGTRNRAGFAERKREAHQRARRLCCALNAREEGHEYDSGDLMMAGRYMRITEMPETGEWEEQP